MNEEQREKLCRLSNLYWNSVTFSETAAYVDSLLAEERLKQREVDTQILIDAVHTFGPTAKAMTTAQDAIRNQTKE